MVMLEEWIMTGFQRKYYIEKSREGKGKLGDLFCDILIQLKRDMNRCIITNWEENAENRGIWRQVRDGCKVSEVEWRSEEVPLGFKYIHQVI